jgi:hypothetical protein
VAVEAGIDVELLKSEIKKTHTGVSEQPERDFVFPTSRSWAEDLDYPSELAAVPYASAEPRSPGKRSATAIPSAHRQLLRERLVVCPPRCAPTLGAR